MRRSDPLPVPSRRRDRASLEDGGRGCPSERALRGRCRQGVSGNCAPSYPSWWRLLLANGLGGQCYRLTNSDIQSLARKAHEFQQADQFTALPSPKRYDNRYEQEFLKNIRPHQLPTRTWWWARGWGRGGNWYPLCNEYLLR